MKIISPYFFSICLFSFFLLHYSDAKAQYQSYTLSPEGDTLNKVDNEGLKQGRWVIHEDPLRGEPGFEAEGVFVDGKKEGPWRKYTLAGDFIALEHYKYGGKDGKCIYFSRFGNLIREENWRGYDPHAPYDTIPVYGQGNNQIISYKIVRAKQYSVKHGDWTFYDPQTGRIIRVDKYEIGKLISHKNEDSFVSDEPMKKIKPKEVLEYEKKNSGKKKVRVRSGATSNDF